MSPFMGICFRDVAELPKSCTSRRPSSSNQRSLRSYEGVPYFARTAPKKREEQGFGCHVSSPPRKPMLYSSSGALARVPAHRVAALPGCQESFVAPCDGFSEHRNSVYVVSFSSARISVSRWRTCICLSNSQEVQDGLVGNELFFIQDVSLINKIISSLVRVHWWSGTSVSDYLVWKYQLQISSGSLCLAWLSSLTEPAFCNESENNVDDLFWQQAIHLPTCLPLSGLFWSLRETRRQNLSAEMSRW